MRPWLEPVAKLSVDHPDDLVVFRVCGDLERSHLDEFFRRLTLETRGFRTIVLDMSSVETFGQAAMDRFTTVSREMAIRDRRFALVALPALLFRHQVRMVMSGREEIRFHETVEDALAAFAREA